jgi:hypothetical protein
MKNHRLMMHPFHLARLFTIVALVTMSAAFAHDEDTKVVDGIAIYLGVVPCEMIEGLPTTNPERQMHGGVPAIVHCHHVMVALFDDASGKRIDHATVSAKVREPGVSGVSGVMKTMEPMAIAGAMTYGNFFSIAETEKILIDVQIRRPGSSHVTTTEFNYHHPMP